LTLTYLFSRITRPVTPIVKPHQFDNVRNYRYKGLYLSIGYNYIIGPFCDWAVEFFPRWMAPNVITLIGFLVNLIPAFLLIYCYGYDLDGQVDPWFSLMVGLTFWFYMFMDNCDGKQARRTGNGSPLGMMFDHQCDCFVAIINHFGIQRMLQTGNGRYSVFMMTISTNPFFACVLEHYYVGSFIHQYISGADDGAFLYVGISIYTWYYGSEELWAKNNVEVFGQSIQLSYLCLAAFACCMFLLSFNNMRAIWAARNSEHSKKVWDNWCFFSHCVFFPLSVATFVIAEAWSPTEIWLTHNRGMQVAHGLQVVYIVTILQYCHVIDSKMNAFRRPLVLTWVLYWINIYFMVTQGTVLFDERILLNSTNLMMLVCILYQMYNAQIEFLDILNIQMFRVKKVKQ